MCIHSIDSTVFCFFTGTTAHVGIKLYGDKAKGEARHLTQEGAFQRNMTNVFLIASTENLGGIIKIRIWHDNTGLSPSWYLARITVRDLQTNNRYHFLANTWFSLNMLDGKIEKELYPAGKCNMNCILFLSYISIK